MLKGQTRLETHLQKRKTPPVIDTNLTLPGTRALQSRNTQFVRFTKMQGDAWSTLNTENFIQQDEHTFLYICTLSTVQDEISQSLISIYNFNS